MPASGSNIPEPPSVLFQAFPLQTYLRNLSVELSEQLSTIKGTLAALQRDAKTSNNTMQQMKSYLRQHAIDELEGQMTEGCLTLPEGTALESVLPVFLRDPSSLSSTGEFPLPIEHLITSEAESEFSVSNTHSTVDGVSRKRTQNPLSSSVVDKRAREQEAEARKRLEHMCAKIERKQNEHMEELQRVTKWLRPIPILTGADTGLSAEDLARRARIQEDLLETMRTAPLFMEFRRHLLRDVADRIAESQETQSMSFGSALVALKEEVRREAQPRQAERPTEEAAGAEVERRLQDIDRRYVLRSEVLASLRDKADVSALVRKADDAYVQDLEGRCEGRFANLEERLALYEAERREFRHILRALVDAQQRPAPAAPRERTQRPRALVAVEDAADPRRALRDEAEGAGTAAGARSGGTGGPGGRQAGAGGRRRGNGAKKVGTKSPETAKTEEWPLQAQPTASKALSLKEMTANQEAYANYVTNELNQRTIEQLPPLPYERRQQ